VKRICKTKEKREGRGLKRQVAESNLFAKKGEIRGRVGEEVE